jgi:16S rRNA (guanine966-N2)-methyltransferase
LTRIVAGKWGGRRLVTPAGERTRPTSEKVRAALASSLTAAGGLEGARVLDLYAGSGALGLELVSRGASSAVFVERDRTALTALKSNVETLGRSDPDVTLTPVQGEVTGFLARAAYGFPVGPFDLVIADPPYDLGTDLVVSMLQALQQSGMLAGHADVIVERGVKSGDVLWPEPLEGVRSRRYGDTLLCYGRAP